MIKIVISFVVMVGVFVMSTTQAAVTDTGVRVPFKEAVGVRLFKKNCSVCHGEWAKGTDKGPPLTYDPPAMLRPASQ